ncbi:MAG: FumA C-terminus/TtdB family hydratase beta subunit [Candidatus Cloacimonetes bacterium]|jgi:fumarate hydratase subunit beta|nr:FumA C-terminus/TtdB family hydratase beta subunit [Candidatus Cloacimonadota bacterium]MDD2229350.1 FumA C-terminus/TtdB family hydratase beta subunit [Candidatus Cloacimonadota bacterium]
MKEYHFNLPLLQSDIEMLSAGDKVYLSGEVFTARDVVHARLETLIQNDQSLPFNLATACIFYCGPSPTPAGKICGAIGPTTSARMDKYTPLLLEHGLRVMIGKGNRSEEVKQAIIDYGAVYFVCIGGASALLSQSVVSRETFMWDDLGAEAIHRLIVRDLPAYVAIV